MTNKLKLTSSITLLFIVLISSACSRVTIKPEGGQRITAQASYEARKPFYFAGLIGAHSIDVNEACEGGNVLQMQTVTTGNDYIFSLITLFIYTPRTAKVWCEA